MSWKQFKKSCVEQHYAKTHEPEPIVDSFESTVTEFQPTTWDDYVGQSMLKNRLQVRVHSAKHREASLPPTLLVAPPGAGKTTLARLIADTLDRVLVTVTKPLSQDELVSKLWSAPGNSVLFVDEVHEWSKKQQHVLMQLTESKTLDGSTGVMSFNELSVILATTDPQGLVAPLVSRMMVQPRWDPYTDEDMAGIIDGMIRMAEVDEWFETYDRSVLEDLVRASAGVPRQAKMLVTAARDMIFAGIEDLDGPTILGFLDMEPDGLTADQMVYLRKLASQPKGQAGLQAMSTLCGMAKQQTEIAEQTLLRNEYITYSRTGRLITPKGRDRLKGKM